MYSILLVDDEPMVKVAFRKMLAGSESFSLTATASNGHEALRALERTPADIVITDINMPKMDGLGLIAGLKQRQFAGAVLVLSNYSEFELVRQALLDGALDYMLKVELNRESLLAHLEKAAHTLEKTRLAAQERVSEGGDAIRRAAALRSFLSDENAPLPPFLRDAEGPLHLLDVWLWPGDGAKHSVSMQNAAEVLRAVFGEADGLDVAEMRPGELVCLAPAARLARGGHTLAGRVDKARHSLGTYFGCRVTVVRGRPAQSPAALPACYAEIRRASALFFYTTQKPLVDAAEVELCDMPAEYAAPAMARQVTALFSQGGEGEIAAYVAGLLAEFERLLVHPRQVKSLLYGINQELVLQLREGARQAEDSTADVALLECESAAALGEAFMRAVPRLLQHVLPPEYHSCKAEVQSALRFIQFNYREKIRLEDIAGAVNLNPSYLCRLFKKETGQSLFQHINTLRMETAARLIERGDVYIKEIAAEVGLEDPFYFTRQFKKYHGVSPSEYKQGREG